MAERARERYEQPVHAKGADAARAPQPKDCKALHLAEAAQPPNGRFRVSTRRVGVVIVVRACAAARRQPCRVSQVKKLSDELFR